MTLLRFALPRAAMLLLAVGPFAAQWLQAAPPAGYPSSYNYNSSFFSIQKTTARVTSIVAARGAQTVLLAPDSPDDAAATIQLPFSFTLKPGEASDKVTISSNGVIRLGAGGPVSSISTPLPAAGMDNTIAPFWDALIVKNVPPSIYTLTSGTAPRRTFVIEYHNVSYAGQTSGDANGISFQVQFEESTGAIQINYLDPDFSAAGKVHNRGKTATIGMQLSMADFVQFSYHQVACPPRTVLRFTPMPVRVAQITPADGSVSPPTDRFELVFSQNVSIPAGAIRVYQGGKLRTDWKLVHPVPGARATIQFPTKLVAARYRVDALDTIQLDPPVPFIGNNDPNRLDGDGNGTAGGTFTAQFDLDSVPVFDPIPDQSVVRGSLLTFTAIARDADQPSQSFRYTLEGAPGGATMNAKSGVFRWTPPVTQPLGTISFTVVATESGRVGATARATVNVTVYPVNNFPPQVSPIPAQLLQPGALMTFQVSATDPNNPPFPLRYALSAAAPSGASIDPQTGVFTWTPTLDQKDFVGPVGVIVSNGNAVSGVKSTTVNFTCVPNPGPTLGTLFYSAQPTVPFASGTEITTSGTFAISATAPLGVDRVEFYLDGSPLDVTGSYLATLDINVLDPGPHALRVRALDRGGAFAEQSWTFTAQVPAPDAPVITTPANNSSTVSTNLPVGGTAAPGTVVQVLLNGVPAGSSILVPANGTFSTVVTLATASNVLTATSTGRGGVSPASEPVSVTLSNVLAPAPLALQATAGTGGRITLTWQAPPGGGTVASYVAWYSAASFAAPESATVISPGPGAATTLVFTPPTSGLWYFRVAALDAGGVRSALSGLAFARTFSGPPSVQNVEIIVAPGGGGRIVNNTLSRGLYNVRLTMDRRLAFAPGFGFRPAVGFPIPVQLLQTGDVVFEGPLLVDAFSPNGLINPYISARDESGNTLVGDIVGFPFTISSQGPVVRTLTLPAQARAIRNEPASGQSTVTAEFTATFDKAPKSGTTPAFSYALSRTNPAFSPVSAVVATADPKVWLVRVVLPSQAGTAGANPEDLTLAQQSVDDFDNPGQFITAAQPFQVFTGTLPPLPGAPVLRAKAIPAGKIRLDWTAITNSADYAVWRTDAPGAPLARSGGQLYYEDLTPSDTTWSYFVTSIRREGIDESYGAPSNTVSAISSRVAPPMPRLLNLALKSYGVEMTWVEDATSGPSAATNFKVYRSASPIGSISGLTAFQTLGLTTRTVDNQPPTGVTYYAVTALDAAGNESAPAIFVPSQPGLLPVASLTITQSDGLLPLVTWTIAPGSPATGFRLVGGTGNVPANWVLISDTATSGYADTGYTPGDGRGFAVTVLGGAGTSSLARDLYLPASTLVTPASATLARGVMNRLTFSVTNNSDQPIENGRMRVRLLGLGVDTPFESAVAGAIAPNSTVQIFVIVPGYPQLVVGTPASLSAQFVVSPHAGEEAIRERTFTAAVTAGALDAEILATGLTRGGDAQTRFRLTNPSTEVIEFLAAQNGAASTKTRISLVDALGNTLSSAPLFLVTGNQTFTYANGRSVVQLAPGATFELLSPIILHIPLGAPLQAFLRLEIDEFYYNGGLPPDGVTLASPYRSQRAVALIDTPYVADLDGVTPVSSNGDQSVVLTGTAHFRSGGNTQSQMPLAPGVVVKVIIANNGFERRINAVSDGTGRFTATYEPIPGEPGGVFSAWASHPDITERGPATTFVINRVFANPQRLRVVATYNQPFNLGLQAVTGPGTTGTNLRFVYSPDDNGGAAIPALVHFNLGASVPAIAAGTTYSLGGTLLGDKTTGTGGQSATNGTVILRLVSDSAGGPVVWGRVEVQYAFADAQPSPSVSPALLETGTSPGTAITESFELSNDGLAPFKNVTVEIVGPNDSAPPSWVALTSPTSFDAIAPGETQPISVALRPPSQNFAQGVYDVFVKVSGTDGATSPTTITRYARLHATVLTGDKGTAHVRVADVRGWVTGAQVSLENDLVQSVRLEGVTDANGEAVISNVPAGFYRVRVQADGHESFTESIQVRANAHAFLDVALALTSVGVQWQIVPTTISDHYELILNLTFETNVPAPVLVVEPPVLNLPPLCAGDVYRGEFSVTNYGLVRADNVIASIPGSDQYFRIELLAPIPDRLEAQQRLRVPYKLTALTAMPGNCATPPGGSGGDPGPGGGDPPPAPCFQYASAIGITYNYTCINNQLRLTGRSQFTYFYRVDSGCPQGTLNPPPPWAGQPGPITPGGGGLPWNGWQPQYGGALSGKRDCYPVADRCPAGLKGEASKCCNQLEAGGSWVNLLRRQYEDSMVDLAAYLPGGPLNYERRYYDQAWHYDFATTRLTGTTQSAAGSPILRSGIIYRPLDDARLVFESDGFRIYKQATAAADARWLWRSPAGRWETYDDNGILHAFGRGSAVEGRLDYDALGRVTFVRDVNARAVLHFGYNGNSAQLAFVEDGAGASPRRVEYYYTGDKLTRVHDVNGNDWVYAYDGSGRLIKKTDPEGRFITVTYDSGSGSTPPPPGTLEIEVVGHQPLQRRQNRAAQHRHYQQRRGLTLVNTESLDREREGV
ncbi:hypothetical protein AYO41_02015 [Verrucomicrobia bacterium SCGC AG-212-E04]|nr:hypothetical protein AYO41_02015 [Verrucomicrobia bacterium SCGC AG-212-E04]